MLDKNTRTGTKVINFREIRNKWREQGEVPDWYSTNSLQFFLNKYSFENETVRERDMTIANVLAENTPKKLPEWWNEDPYTKGLTPAQVYFNMLFRDGYAIASTPLKANAGLPDRGFTVSCSGQVLQNNIASKYMNNAEIAILTKYSHGTSIDISSWLSEGDPIGEGEVSEGIMPIVDLYTKTTSEVTQGTRRGSIALYLDIEHGDFYRLAQRAYESPDGLNVGWIVKDSFIEKLKKQDAEALARWERALYVRLAKGRGYIAKVDTMNRNKSDVFKNLQLDVKASNLCVAPETLILTDQGYYPIKSLVDTKQKIWNGEEWSIVDVVKTGSNQKLIKVVTDSGQELECTEYHKFYVMQGDGYNGKYIEKRANELVEGDKLIKFDLPVIEGYINLDNAYDNGFFSADGCYRQSSNKNHQLVYLYGDKILCKPRLTANYRVDKKEKNRQYMLTSDLKEKFFVPDARYTVKSRLEWLAGYFDGDGCVYKNGLNQQLTATSINRDFLKDIQLMLQTLGINSKIKLCTSGSLKRFKENQKEYQTQPCYRLLIPSNETQALIKLGIKLNRLVLNEYAPNRNATRFVKIEKIIDNGRIDDTYCFTEHKRGMGIFNGILTGQCAEVNLPANDDYTFTCVIMNANLALYDEFPKHCFHIIHMMQDANISNYLKQIESLKPHNRQLFEKAYRFTKDFRSVGKR